jgi:lipoprotein signal peptidase
MKTFKTTLLVIIFTLPFLCADLYTKYLAHTELPNEGDQIVLIKPLNAVSPIINYGSFLTVLFGIENSKENPNIFAHLIMVPLIIVGAYAAFYAVGGGIASILWFMFLGGALGNGIEVAIFSGATDFLSTNTGNPSFDLWVFNVADIFLFIPFLFCIIPIIYIIVTYFIWERIIYDKIIVPIREKILWPLKVKLGITEEYRPEPPKYSEELTLEVVSRYKAGETLEKIATALEIADAIDEFKEGWNSVECNN